MVPECDEAFCLQCLQFHSYAKSTKKHAVLDVCDYEKLPSFVLEIKTQCSEHQTKFQNYCKIYECPCCSKCISTSHKSCNDLPPIDEVVQNAKSSASLVDIEERLHQLREFFGKLGREKEDNKKEITNECKIILEQIKQKRISLNSHLDKIENDVLQKISELETSSCHQIQTISQDMKAKEERIGDMLKGVIKMRQHASNLQTFLANNELEKQTRYAEETAEDLTKNGTIDITSIVFQENSLLASFESDVKSFGEVSITTRQSIVMQVKQTDKQTQIATLKKKTFEFLCLELITPVNICGLEVFGCVLLKNGNTIFSNYKSKELIVIDNNSSSSYTITLPFNPYDISCIDETRLAVTGGANENKVYIVSLEKKVIERTILTYHGCYGICYSNGKLICSNLDKGLIEVDLNTKKLTVLNIGTTRADGYVAAYGKHIYNGDGASHTVTCWNSDLKQVWTFKNKNVLRGLRGIAIDNQGNVYLGCIDSNHCVIISPEDRKYKQITLNGISRPRTLYFNHYTSQMLVCGQSGPAGVFSVSY